jgi:hypothetical protein
MKGLFKEGDHASPYAARASRQTAEGSLVRKATGEGSRKQEEMNYILHKVRSASLGHKFWAVDFTPVRVLTIRVLQN